MTKINEIRNASLPSEHSPQNNVTSLPLRTPRIYKLISSFSLPARDCGPPQYPISPVSQISRLLPLQPRAFLLVINERNWKKNWSLALTSRKTEKEKFHLPHPSPGFGSERVRKRVKPRNVWPGARSFCTKFIFHPYPGGLDWMSR